MTPIDDSEIKIRLLDYLARLSGRADLAYDSGPDRITGGRDAAIFGFQLSDAPERVYTALAGMNYPVPRVAVVEPDATILGVHDHDASRGWLQ